MSAAEGEGGAGRRLTFSDKDEHMYFWFPLLAGLSELTFDPRQDIRYSALEVRFLSTCHLIQVFPDFVMCMRVFKGKCHPACAQVLVGVLLHSFVHSPHDSRCCTCGPASLAPRYCT